ncbi:MAG: hypothetical protein ABNH21_06540 [Glaciecola sp.]|jgi:hypothetical protein
MPGVLIDANVSGSVGTRIFTSPSAPLQNPNNVNAEQTESIATPSNFSELSVAGISNPNAINEQSAVDLSAPNTFVTKAIDPEAPPFPLNHARILYNSVLLGSSVSASGTTPELTLVPNTADRWSFETTSTVTYTLPSTDIIDTVCIGAHNLKTAGYTVQVQYSTTTGGSFVNFGPSITPTGENLALMQHLSSAVSVRRLRIVVTGSGAAYIGSVYAGTALQMQRPFFSGHTPLPFGAVTDYYNPRTESGNYIGREIRRRQYQTSAPFKNLTDYWVRTYLAPFIISARSLPFYFAWNLLEHPTDVGFAMVGDDIQPSYQGNRDLMSVSFDVIGIG